MPTRRKVLKALGTLGVMGLNGCDNLISFIGQNMGQGIPDALDIPQSTEVDFHFHLLSRAGFAPWIGELQQAKQLGTEQWLEQQLEPETIDDSLCDLRARRFETLHLQPGNCYEFKRDVLRRELVSHTLLRAIYSRRQLLEVMTEFWSDHFNIYLEKGDCIYLKTTDDQTVIRPNALGNFRNLLRCSATSPAMLVYLDGKDNKKSNEKEIPNENYARELLELHTLGVDGGYTQQDVYETARALTGWRLRGEGEFFKGTVYFDQSLHDYGQKTVLGQVVFAEDGSKELDQIIDILCQHPSTARYIAKKLVQRFVSDTPPLSLVEKVASSFLQYKGEIKPMIRTIFLSTEFSEHRGNKFKRPFRYIASTLRLLGADVHSSAELLQYLYKLGHAPFAYPTPDGYPEDVTPWLGTLIWRWNFAFALTQNKIDAIKIDVDNLWKIVSKNTTLGNNTQTTIDFYAHSIGRVLSKDELSPLLEYIQQNASIASTEKSELIALMLSSPFFQRY